MIYITKNRRIYYNSYIFLFIFSNIMLKYIQGDNVNILINNVNIHYEVYGNGKPILLLHGNGESMEIFDKLISKLKLTHTVYAIDSRCHGLSQNTEEISYELIAQDIIEFIHKLNITKPIIYGFSDGGIISLIIAIKEPYLLDKIILSGANIFPKGMKWSTLLLCKLSYFLTRNKLVKMMCYEPNISLNSINTIVTPTYILAGENDVILYKHTKLIADNIPNSTLEIIPGENHSSYIIHSEKIYNIIKKYI